MTGGNIKAAYGDLALMYDELVGQAAFDCWRENFERLVNRYSVSFTTAADVACGTGLAASRAVREGFRNRPERAHARCG